MNRGPLDICPDDLGARISLRDQLADARRAIGISSQSLGLSIGVGPTGISKMEHLASANLFMSTYTRIANALGLTLRLQPADVPGYDETWHWFEDVNRPDYQQAAVLERLVDARRYSTLASDVLAARIGISLAALRDQERLLKHDGQLSTWQRYVRGAGGRLNIVLEPVCVA